MKRPIGCLGVAVIGFALMASSYFNYQYDATQDAWKSSYMYIGASRPAAETGDIQYINRPVRLLPLSGRAQDFVAVARGLGPDVLKPYRVLFQEKVVLYGNLSNDFTEQMLASGRLPTSGSDEVVAGFQAAAGDTIDIEGRTFAVVGRLARSVRVFANSYLMGDIGAATEVFDANNQAVQNAYIIRSSKHQLRDSQMLGRLVTAFPKSRFTAYTPSVRTAKKAFYPYIAGMTLLLLAGSVFLAEVHCAVGKRVRNKWLEAALSQIGRHKGLLIKMHLAYFGIVVLFMLLVYQLPELQTCLLLAAQTEVTGGSGPLGVAGKAYMSKNIPLAAAVTFGVNFILGSAAVITVPSLILPGVGVLVAGFRAVLWGMLLCPCSAEISRMMLPHSLTLLLEGEGYVVAAFFGLLVPMYLLRRAEAVSLGRRYSEAVLTNVSGNILVAIVLAAAAIYEAVEVILAMS